MQIILKKKIYTDQDKTFNVDEGSVYIENYNETLDSATIRISHITEPLNLEPFDKVILHDEENRLTDKYMCIDTYTEMMESLDPITYSYEISLCSETKELETNILPNLSITKPLDGSYRSVWYYLEQYLNLYDEKIRRNRTEYKEFTQTISKFLGIAILPTPTSFELTGFVKTDNMTIINVRYDVLNGTATNFSMTYNDTSTVVNFDITLLAEVKITIQYYETNIYENKHYYYSLVESKFDSINCPEMQWNAPTLREVLTDLMMVADCIPVVRNNSISFIDLTKKKNDISNNSHINYIQRSQSSEDYVSELKMNMVNVMQTSVEGVKQTVNRMENLTFKAESDGFVVTDENLILQTQYPILKVNHLWMTFQIMSNADGGIAATYKYDLCGFSTAQGKHVQLLYEYSEFNTLPIAKINPTDFNTIYQNMCVYYSRYSNEIKGFSQKTKDSWIFDTKIITLNVIKNCIWRYCNDMDGNRHTGTNFDDELEEENVYFSTFFEIEYETTADAVFKASKDIAPTHNRVVADNQTYSFVDAYNQGFMEYQKVNRLGNKQLFINGRYENGYSNLIKIGDYYNDSIVYQTQYQIYKNHIEVNAIATKDYILRDYFTGVKARIRSWNYAPASESFTRHELIKYYLEFSKSQKDDYIYPIYNVPEYFLTPLFDGYIRPLKYVGVAINAVENMHPNNYNYYFALDLLGRIIGNSLIFTFGFDDNFTAGKRVSSELQSSNIDANYINGTSAKILRIRQDFTKDYGGIPLEECSYVNSKGEFYNITYNLTYDVDDPDALHNQYGEISDPNDPSKFFLYRVSKLPEMEKDLFSDYSKIFGIKEIYKDNKEIIKLSLQYEFCVDTHDIVFTKKFLELQECIREAVNGQNHGDSVTNSIKIYQGSSENFDWKNLSLNNTTEVVGASLSFTHSSKTSIININNVNNETTSVFYITDASDNILLAVKGVKQFYLNLLESRDYNIYNSDREPVGTI